MHEELTYTKLNVSLNQTNHAKNNLLLHDMNKKRQQIFDFILQPSRRSQQARDSKKPGGGVVGSWEKRTKIN